MRDLVGFGVFGTDGGDASVGGFAGFGKRVVARVEIFAFLERSSVWILFSMCWNTCYGPSTYSAIDLSCLVACHRVGTDVARPPTVSAVPGQLSAAKVEYYEVRSYIDINFVLLVWVHDCGSLDGCKLSLRGWRREVCGFLLEGNDPCRSVGQQESAFPSLSVCAEEEYLNQGNWGAADSHERMLAVINNSLGGSAVRQRNLREEGGVCRIRVRALCCRLSQEEEVREGGSG